jgi:predicted dehydrogenase
VDRAGLGFVGLGRAAGRLADAAKSLPHGRVVAVCSRDVQKATEFAALHGAAKVYTRYEEMLADDDIAGVVIASANVAHEAQAVRAASCGKHVFCEKPMGRNAEEASHIFEACRRAAVVLGVGYHLRYHPLIQQARDAVRRGDLGQVRLIRAHFYVGSQYDRSGWRSSAEESGGGAIVSTGVHVIDTFHFILDDVAETASMLCDALPIEEVCSAMLSFRSGAYGMFDTSRVIPHANAANNIEIYGDRGCCSLLNVLGGWVPDGSGFIQENQAGRVDLTTDRMRNLYTDELADWITAFTDGGAPLAGGTAGVLAAGVMDALYRNAIVCSARQAEGASARS